MPDTETRLNHLETEVSCVTTDVKRIMENHLPHINQSIVRLETQIRIYGGLIIAGITALIVIGLTPLELMA